MAQKVVNVSISDPRIVYSGGWNPQDGGNYVYTVIGGSGFTFTFQGTSISYLSVHNPNGGVATVFVDDGPTTQVDESANTAQGAGRVEAYLFTQSGLDSTQEHVFQLNSTGVGQFGGQYVESYGLQYIESTGSTVTTKPVISTVSDSSPPSANAPAPSPNDPVTSPKEPVSTVASITTSTTTTSPRGPTSVVTISAVSTGSTSDVAKDSVPSSTVLTPSPTTLASTSFADTVSSPTAFPSETASKASTPAHQTALIGSIVGGIIGVIAAAIAISFLRMVYRRRRRAQQVKQDLEAERRPTPYDAPALVRGADRKTATSDSLVSLISPGSATEHAGDGDPLALSSESVHAPARQLMESDAATFSEAPPSYMPAPPEYRSGYAV